MWTHVLVLTFPVLLLTACATERIVEKPVPVEVIRVEQTPVPDDLLILHAKTTIPDTLTYGEAIQLWAEDRALVDILNGQLIAIGKLNEQTD